MNVLMDPKIDKPLSFSLSVFIHIAVFAVAGASFIKPPQFGVDHGVNSIEINFVPTPTEVVSQLQAKAPVKFKSDFAEKQIMAPVAKIVEKKTSGALSEAKPDYLKNPAPEYPEAARQRGYEGLVFLTVDVDKNGIPARIEIEKSSGHLLLDEAALNAVKAWKFHPGRIGNMPIESEVRVPIRFYLDESK